MISNERLGFLDRFGDGDHQDMAKTIFELRAENEILKAQIEELEHSQMKRENNILRKSISDINRNYVEIVNENLALRRELGR